MNERKTSTTSDTPETQDRSWKVRFEVRPDERGEFDEFLVYVDDFCLVHFEMMDDNCLWIGAYPPGGGDGYRLVFSAKSKLKILCEED